MMQIRQVYILTVEAPGRPFAVLAVYSDYSEARRIVESVSETNEFDGITYEDANFDLVQRSFYDHRM